MLEVGGCMDSYEKIIKLIREEAARDKQRQLYIGDMTGPDTCSVNGLELEADDFLVSDFLVDDLEEGDRVLVCRIGDEFILIAKVVRL